MKELNNIYYIHIRIYEVDYLILSYLYAFIQMPVIDRKNSLWKYL